MTCFATTPATPLAARPKKEGSVTYAAPGAPPADWGDHSPGGPGSGGSGPGPGRSGLSAAEPPLVAEGPLAALVRLASRVITLCWVELRKIRHDRTELYTRAIQPALWLLIYGEVFTHVRAIPTPRGVPYLDYLAPGILAQSALFIAIFYGIQIIWERDAGVLTKLMVTPTPRSALITGKAFASGVRSLIQGVAIVVIAALLGVSLTANPLKLLAAAIVLMLGSAFFACLSMTIAGFAVSRDRLMGIGQAITMPLFFSSSALYPASIMPGWLQVISTVNPLTYEVEALRSLLIGTSTSLWLDGTVLAGSTIAGITAASLLLPRLAAR
jgi:ABC-2 type transport system permease protein